jgi:FtsP/CotA-like multicopper oxidase with cupredoxin domain
MLSRRALLAGGVSSFAAPAILAARAQNATDSAAAAPTILRLERRDIEVNGKTASVYGIRQPNGTFGIRTEVDKPFRVRVENGIGEPSLIHWHGLTPPRRQDGVPGISGPPIPPGARRERPSTRSEPAGLSGKADPKRRRQTPARDRQPSLSWNQRDLTGQIR